VFLRAKLEFDAGRALSALALVVLAPFAAGAIARLIAPGPSAPLLAWLAGVHAANPLTAFILGVIGMFLLARAFAEWEVRPPLALSVSGAVVAALGLAGVLVTRAAPPPPTLAWAIGLVAAGALAAAVWKFASIREEEEEEEAPARGPDEGGPS
jgi:hypothetical protein